ncbi:hypothetical protein SDRG_16099 [Saprolegnia diclina VS20]|uniref:Uncharacterized protein n=1 Tax=Saprolegnia diclina (strain VS20) TaxID=1156394 RepID=T0R1Z7_SAPDV|nr:hypothetical protein SDRG_16099 [Saprolegnia diclina VS20]EQC26033.1 hypothetical protein SDRG_16099 [Saprolegnia diclina VS20]|eukprot:XP_008620518.1 hypothetical protein SDRG_16099 [Saprolegnia diclina VS20]
MSLIVHCNYCDLITDEKRKDDLRKYLEDFQNKLATVGSPDLGAYNSLMESVVCLVVEDALGRIKGLKRYRSAATNRPGEGFLRSVQWGIEGFKVFKNMKTDCQAGDDLANYVPLVECVEQNWSALALVLMESIVCCLRWLHRTVSCVLVPGALTLSRISVGDGRVGGVSKADKTVVCTTNDVHWTTLPGDNWRLGSTAFAPDSSNKLSSSAVL